jgi:hypothetical protein
MAAEKKQHDVQRRERKNEHGDGPSRQAVAPSQIGRRRFLTSLALGAGAAPILFSKRFGSSLLGAAQAPPPPQNLRTLTSRVLAPTDFTYLGCMRVPEQISQFSHAAIAARMVGGRLQFFMTGNNSADAAPDVLDAVFEFADTGSYNVEPTIAPRADLIVKWGDIYQGKRIRYENGRPVQLEYLSTAGMTWYNNRLYWTYFDYYNTDQRPDPSLGMTDLRGSPSQMVAYGPWNADISSHHSSGWLVLLPDGTLGVGSLPQGGNAGSAWGPELIGGSPWPTDTTRSGPTAPPLHFTRTYLQYGYLPSLGDLDNNGRPIGVVQRCKRPANYIWNGPGNPDINPLTTGGQGYWTEADGTDACVYINLPDKVGILFASALGIGNVWYGDPLAHGGNPCGGGQGENANGFQMRWHIFDPADCQRVIAGTLQPYEIVARHDFNPAVTIAPMSVGCNAMAGGMYFEPSTRKLYVSVRSSEPTTGLPLVHVFQIN